MITSPQKRTRLCQLPSPGSITGRSSSITNAFFNAIIPIYPPTLAEELEALTILEMDPDDVRCAYCGDKSTEWDHLRPIITGKKPTGFITELANLVPACGKCNQSKGKQEWRQWMLSSAPLSPRTRRITDLEKRFANLEHYECWRTPLRINFEEVVDAEVWERHEANRTRVLELLKESQILAKRIRVLVSDHLRPA